MSRIRVGIAGVTGYAGQELLRLLLGHPQVRLAYLASSGRSDAAASLRHFGGLPAAVDTFSAAACARRCGAAFLALPHEASLEAAPRLLSAGVRVFDLSAAFRLKDPGLYPRYYRFSHTAPALLAKAVYGLPELHAPAIRRARLVAVPGCYPTGPALALAPLLRRKVVAGPVIVDAKSGVTGAGRETRPDLMFSEVAGSLRAYNVFAHRHEPELAQSLAAAAGRPVGLTFTPHLVPMNRGILSTIYARLRPGRGRAHVLAAWRTAYAGCPCVRVLADGLPDTRGVHRTNFCDLGTAVRGRDAILIAALDNLVKGASGQAIQAFNVAYGLPEAAGLGAAPGAP